MIKLLGAFPASSSRDEYSGLIKQATVHLLGFGGYNQVLAIIEKLVTGLNVKLDGELRDFFDLSSFFVLTPTMGIEEHLRSIEAAL
ncbi:MAG: hypothetical protein ABII23_09135 [bacterium]